MKITYKSIYHSDQSFYEDYWEYKEVSTELCCDEMRECWGDAIKFGESDVSVNRFSDATLHDVHHYPEGAVYDDYPINFCPFCGVEIVCEEGEKVQVVSEKKEIVKEVYESKEVPFEPQSERNV